MRKERLREKRLKQVENDAEALHQLQLEIDERDITLKQMRAERLGIQLPSASKQVSV